MLGTKAAANSTETAEFSLIAIEDIAGHGVSMPAESTQAAIQDLFARGNAIVVYVDGKTVANGVETFCVFVRGKPRDTGGPFGANVLGSAKGGGVVDDRAAAKAFAC